MRLEEWLKKKGLSMYAFGKIAGVSPPMFAKIINGTENIGSRIGVKIEKATNGEVSRIEAVWPEYSCQKINDAFREKKDALK